METLPTGNANKQRPLSPDTLVLRALLRRLCLDENKKTVLPDAFLPRVDGKDDEGLSVHAVNSSELVHEVQEFSKQFKKIHGVAKLITFEVRQVDTKLDVVADPLENLPNHALITGVPNPIHDPMLAERFAGQLARICAIVS